MDGFGERLRRLRKDRDITQGQLAAQIGVVASAVGKYERLPDSYPSVEALVKIADFFDVSIDYLLRGTQPVLAAENSVSGHLTNSSVMQANHGGVVFNGENKQAPSPEAMELLRIYGTLKGRDRLRLLNYAVELEGGSEE